MSVASMSVAMYCLCVVCVLSEGSLIVRATLLLWLLFCGCHFDGDDAGRILAARVIAACLKTVGHGFQCGICRNGDVETHDTCVALPHVDQCHLPFGTDTVETAKLARPTGRFCKADCDAVNGAARVGSI